MFGTLLTRSLPISGLYPPPSSPCCLSILTEREIEREEVFLLTLPASRPELCPNSPIQPVNAENNLELRYERNEDKIPLRNAPQYPTLPRANGVSCPVCGHRKKEIYVPNMEERMVPVYACFNPKCGDHNGRSGDHNGRSDDENSD
ncbi:hypothetical protein MA16_Dca004612 [Dendrobium catenatum]|uniref:Uncharacterized protein n=1 Tax=Dendrobium catenatum TaxID=906689 RepID=A0A2I0VNL2_9ASPA|nr:hypothetical protein MA16_Dca004612 [Dendrobium catenatum]